MQEIESEAYQYSQISEKKKKWRGTKDLDGFTMIYSRVDQYGCASIRVGILIDQEWKF